MKKVLKIFAGSLIAGFLFGLAIPVFAAEEAATPGDTRPTLKVYYSESLGTGEKVFHMNACNKTQAYGPVKCAEEFFAGRKFGRQCDKKDDIGKPIRGCMIPKDNDFERVGGTSFLAVDIDGFTKKEKDGGCSDAPAKQAYLMGKMWAKIAESLSEQTVETLPESVIEDTVVGDINGPKPETSPEFILLPMYEASICATWDIVKEGGKAEDEAAMNDPKQLAILNDTIKPDGGDVTAMATEDGCNSTRHESKLDKAPRISCNIVERITGKSGTDIFSKYVKAIYTWASSIVGIIAVLTMVYSGIQISMAGGDSAKIDSAKTRITQSIVGIVILFLSGLILYTINPSFFT